MPEQIEDRWKYGCIHCRAGSEEELIRKIAYRFPKVRLIRPTKLRVNHALQGKEEVVLFPGYVLVKAEDGFPLPETMKGLNTGKIVTYGDGSWQLHGSDAGIAQALFETNGRIDLSEAYYEGERLRIRSGFLKSYENDIVRVNRRMQTAEVKMTFCDRECEVWLGFELT